MPLAEQHVGHLVVVRADEEALDLPDFTVESMDRLTLTNVCLADRNDVFHHGRPVMSQARADSPTGDTSADPQGAGIAGALDRIRAPYPPP